LSRSQRDAATTTPQVAAVPAAPRITTHRNPAAPQLWRFLAVAVAGAAAGRALPALALQVTDRVKISEVCYDPGEDPEAPFEFVELYNVGTTTAFLDGAVISDQGNSGSNETTFQFPGTALTGTNIALPPGQFLLLVVSAIGSAYANIDYEFYGGSADTDDPAIPNLVKTSGLGTDLGLANTGDGLTLSVGLSTGNVIPCGEVVDGLSWKDGGGVSEVNAMSRTVCSDPAPHPGTADPMQSLQRLTSANDTDRSAADFGVAVRTPRGPAPCLLDPACLNNASYAPCVPLANSAVTISVHAGAGPWASVRMFHKLDTAATYDSMTMVPGPNSTFIATVPGQANLARVLYFVRARDPAGDVVTVPPAAPAVPQDYRVGIVSIAQIQGNALADTCGTSSLKGQAVNVRGVVTHEAAEFDVQSLFVQRGTEPNSGIRVFVPDYSFLAGFRDSVEVSGVVDEVDCETRIVLFPGCGQILALHRRVMPRVLAGVGEIRQEQNEGMLVTVAGPILVASSFDTTGTDVEFKVGGGANAAWVGGDTFGPDPVGYSYRPSPGDVLDALTGIVAVRHPNANDPIVRLRLEPRRDNDVDRDYTDVGDAGVEVVRAFRLGPNVPNPFNPLTTLEYVVPEAADVRLDIFDARGTHVRTLVAPAHAEPGTARVTWNGANDAGHALASGLYIVRLSAGAQSASRKMLLLR